MGFQNKPLRWDNKGVEPSEETKTNGFKAGYKPPANMFNHFFHNTAIVQEELQSTVSSLGAKIEEITADNITDKQLKILNTAIQEADQKATHANREVLDGITEEKITDWDRKATLADISNHNTEEEAHTFLQNRVEELKSRVTRLEDMILYNITGNPYMIAFDTLDGLVVEGVYNQEKQRIEF